MTQRERFFAELLPGAINIDLDDPEQRLSALLRYLGSVAYCRGAYSPHCSRRLTSRMVTRPSRMQTIKSSRDTASSASRAKIIGHPPLDFREIAFPHTPDRVDKSRDLTLASIGAGP